MIFGIIDTILIIWLALLTYLFLQLRTHYNNLIRIERKGSEKTLQGVLEALISNVETTNKRMDQIDKINKLLEQKEALHIQKIGLLRFNPFKDTGGDQSFVLALLNDHDTGIVISGLYARSGTRWYAKKVDHGKGMEYELSDEEKKTISLAEAK